MELTVDMAINWMEIARDKYKENKETLTMLDQAIGDGDHGINMARGYQAVVEKIAETEYDHPADVLKSVAMTLMAKVGGASGPLYGTAFMNMSMVMKGKTVDQKVLKEAIDHAITGMKQRGKSEIGEKTLLDVWDQVSSYLDSEDLSEPKEIIEVCQAVVEDTKQIQATKGRASYLNERSIGHEDPGSMSSFYLFEALAEVLEKEATV
ncbi:dihydroxyacetone kinase subunit DhaL [Saliterribacillus persicus]|uniref:phosphoenolpyruvate--glycerone phosphotransferase n=1 Tax=Saliterribacillus persicus TaxID=930114 RepID=A0A368Y3N9_9BACI|nr:dihydroxyacetone kinase subunit DhaL [Saliterribacillus persicus]RCW74802.1 dihydroxyacetone kinase DhaL subunit [Saliterribacillus persicus]